MTHRHLALTLVLLSACPPSMPTPDGGAGTAPVVTSISPLSGPVAGGTTVTINGTNFVSGAAVLFGSTPATTTFESDRKLTAISPASSSPGAVAVTVTNPGGKSSSLPGAFTYTSTTTTRIITEAVLQNPAQLTDTSGALTVELNVVATVQVAAVTNGAGQGAGVRAQVGSATTVGATPVSADFTWVDAAYVGDADGPASGDLLRDSYAGKVTLAGGASQLNYFLAARFSVDDGATWTIADRDGSANGVQGTQLARVTLTSSSVDWCKLGGEAIEAPPTVMLRGSAAGPVVYGQVFKMDVTSRSGAGPGIKGALGYGAPGTAPATWTWTDASFNTDTGGGANDEFQATLPNPGVGTWKYAFRFNASDGAWSYCDADGLGTNGFTEDQAGTLTVTDATVDSCVLQFPAALTSYEGRQTEQVYGRVFVQGLTEAIGPAAGIEGQLGYGAPSTAPSDPSWIWTSGSTFNIDDPGGGEEYSARLSGPMPGSFAFAYRFRLAGGAWTYCDQDGSANGLQQNQLGALTALPFDVSTCSLEAANATQTVLPNTVSQPYTALITVPTLTETPGQGTPVSVQLGSGATGSDPATWTNWRAATWTSDVAAANRYSATLMAPGTPGAQAVAYRVQVGTRPPVFCDLDGSQNGFQAAQAGRLTVATAFIQSCRLDTVSTSALPSGSPLTVTARALIPGVSAGAGASPNLRVQIGVGPQGDDASTSALWGWQEAGFAADVTASGEDEFSLTTFPAYTGNRAVSARASLDGTSWTYCDLNGSDVNGYEVGFQYDVQVSPHVEFDFCNLQAPFFADGGTTIYGQVYEPGLTPNPAVPFIAQLGVGVESGDPGLAWSWRPASFNVTSGNNNEYQAVLPADAGVGLSYAFRYSLDAGVWCYGDINGSSVNGFTGGSNLGLVTP